VRLLLLFFASAFLLFSGTIKLYLKDGGYHVVREYHVEGDRVKFFATERGEWEEMPAELIDLQKTQAEQRRVSETEHKEEQQIDEEEQAEREVRKEIASVPMETGAYFRVDNQVRKLDAAPYQVVTNKKRAALKALSPIPLIPGKASVVIQGEHSKFIVHDERPIFYFRPEREERFGIIRVEPKKNARVVENVSIVPVANQAVEDRRVIEVFQQQMAGNLYKVWPEKPIEPGEYAVIEYSDSEGNTKDDLELAVWDFAYQPQK